MMNRDDEQLFVEQREHHRIVEAVEQESAYVEARGPREARHRFRQAPHLLELTLELAAKRARQIDVDIAVEVICACRVKKGGRASVLEHGIRLAFDVVPVV
jgi:hypothetical protein